MRNKGAFLIYLAKEEPMTIRFIAIVFNILIRKKI